MGTRSKCAILHTSGNVASSKGIVSRPKPWSYNGQLGKESHLAGRVCSEALGWGRPSLACNLELGRGFSVGKNGCRHMTQQLRVITRMQEMGGQEDIPEKSESQIHVMYGWWLWFTLTLSYRNHEPKNVRSGSEGMKHEGF